MRQRNAFDERLKETKKKAIEENIQLAEKTGATLTQTIDADGNLVGATTQTIALQQDVGNNENISVADIRSELFEGDNIVTAGKKDPLPTIVAMKDRNQIYFYFLPNTKL